MRTIALGLAPNLARISPGRQINRNVQEGLDAHVEGMRKKAEAAGIFPCFSAGGGILAACQAGKLRFSTAISP